MRFGSLFTGIGGMDLGLERAGMTCAFQVEIDAYCRGVLARHWPQVPKYSDVTKFCRRIVDCEPEDEEGNVRCPRCEADFAECGCAGTDQVVDECGPVDLLCGGFPCQDVSQIGRLGGITDGTRSGLWFEFARVVRELGPRIVLVENVSNLLVGGLDVVLGELAALGYDAEWDSIPAYSVGAPHRRDRVFVLAYARGEGLERHAGDVDGGPRWAFPDGPTRSRGVFPWTGPRGWWSVESAVGRVAHGVPRRVDRINALGNAVVPQVIEWIGRRILERESR